MDLMSILGWVLAIFVILFGIMFDSGTGGFIVINLKSFFDLPSIVVVLGGVIAALMVSFPLKCFTRIPRHLKIILLPTKYNPQEYIDQIVELATEARINGLLSLEEKLKDTKDAVPAQQYDAGCGCSGTGKGQDSAGNRTGISR